MRAARRSSYEKLESLTFNVLLRIESVKSASTDRERT